jgi:hypothetical protein
MQNSVNTILSLSKCVGVPINLTDMIERILYTKDNVTFYLPRPFHFLSYQLNRL